MSNIDVYQEVTDRIIEALEHETVPCRHPWISSTSAHRNPISGTEYRGINPFLLDMTAWEMGYKAPLWLTFKQAKAKGACIRKGEKSTLVIFWKILKGKDVETGEDKGIPLLRHYRVFNIEQVDGYEYEIPEPETVWNPIFHADDIIYSMPNMPSMTHGGNRAFYSPPQDHVQLPPCAQFETASGYYATAFHELIHSTGHQMRLNRDEVVKAKYFGSENYAREELVAEFGAAMLCAQAGIEPRTDQSAAYIKGWLKSLRNDHKLVISAAGRAQRGADYILGKTDKIEKISESSLTNVSS
jgi:antirestriction protein ArdC